MHTFLRDQTLAPPYVIFIYFSKPSAKRFCISVHTVNILTERGTVTACLLTANWYFANLSLTEALRFRLGVPMTEYIFFLLFETENPIQPLFWQCVSCSIYLCWPFVCPYPLSCCSLLFAPEKSSTKCVNQWQTERHRNV